MQAGHIPRANSRRLSQNHVLFVSPAMIAHALTDELPSERALEHRPRLLGLAYRMLGDIDEAEDIVQEAFLRWQQTDRRAVRSSEAWLVAVVSRLAIDRLRRLKTERAA